jgi:hypothetical protein
MATDAEIWGQLTTGAQSPSAPQSASEQQTSPEDVAAAFMSKETPLQKQQREMFQLHSSAPPPTDSVPTDPGSAWDRAWNTVTGSGQYDPAIEELSAQGFDFGNSLKLAAAYATTPDPAALAEIAVKTLPNSTRSQDDKGNEIITWNNKQYYINRPGFSGSDGFKFLADVASFVPAMKIAGAATNLVTRIGLAGGLSGATSVAQDVAAGELGSEQGISGERAALAAAGGFVGEPIAKLISSGLRLGISAIPKIKDIIGNARYLKNGEFTEAGRKAAETAGFDVASMSKVIKEQFNAALGRAQQAMSNPRTVQQMASDAVPPGAMNQAGSDVLQAEFPIPLTRGQRTQDMNMLRREEGARQGGTGDAASTQMRASDDLAQDAMLEQAAGIGERMVPQGSTATVPATALGTIQATIQNQATKADEAIASAYNTVNKLAPGVKLSAEAVRQFPRRVLANWRENDILIDETVTPLAYKLMNDIKKYRKTEGAFSLSQADFYRRKIGKFIDAAKEPTDKRALISAKSSLDNFIDDTLENTLKSTDTEALTALKNARALRADYGQKYGLMNQKDDGGKFVQKLLTEDNTDNLARSLLGAGQVYPQSMSKVIDRLKSVLPEEEFTNVRQMAWLHIANRGIDTAIGGGKSFSSQKFATSLQKALNDNRVVMGKIFSPAQLAEMRRFGTIVEKTITPKDALNPSRSAFAFAGLMRDFFRNSLSAGATIASGPVAGAATNIGMREIQKISSKSAARRMANPGPTTPRSFPLAQAVTPAIAAQQEGTPSELLARALEMAR